MVHFEELRKVMKQTWTIFKLRDQNESRINYGTKMNQEILNHYEFNNRKVHVGYQILEKFIKKKFEKEL